MIVIYFAHLMSRSNNIYRRPQFVSMVKVQNSMLNQVPGAELDNQKGPSIAWE